MARRYAYPRVTSILAAAALATSLLALTAWGAQPSPQTRAYAAHLSGGSGAYALANGHLQVTVTLTNAGKGSAPSGTPGGGAVQLYTARVLMRGAPCAHQRGCRVISGSLSGEAAMDPRNPPIADLPSQIKLSKLRGSIRGLGAVLARGELVGTGFIRSARRTLSLTIAVNGGRLAISGVGPPVPGFTPP